MKSAEDYIDELLLFLPKFKTQGRKFAEWNSHYPIYHTDVEEFFKSLSQDFWYSRDYICANANQMLDDPGLIANANLQEVKTMLTACWRGERFSYGRWEKLLEDGKITNILERLEALRKQFSS